MAAPRRLAAVFLVLLCGSQLIAADRHRRSLLQDGSLGGLWASGQGRITDVSAVASATTTIAGSQVASSAATAYTNTGGDRSGTSAFAQAYAASLTSAASQDVNAVAQVIGQSSTEGGDAQIALAVAFASAFSTPGGSIALAQAISVSINSYGCATIAFSLALAGTIAQADGTFDTFSQSIASVTSVGSCYAGNTAEADAQASVELDGFGGRSNLQSSPARAAPGPSG